MYCERKTAPHPSPPPPPSPPPSSPPRAAREAPGDVLRPDVLREKRGRERVAGSRGVHDFLDRSRGAEDAISPAERDASTGTQGHDEELPAAMGDGLELIDEIRVEGVKAEKSDVDLVDETFDVCRPGILGDVGEVHGAKSARRGGHHRGKEPVDLAIVRGDEEVGFRDERPLFLSHPIVAQHPLVVGDEDLLPRGLEVDELKRSVTRKHTQEALDAQASKGLFHHRGFAIGPERGHDDDARARRKEPAGVRRDVEGDSAGAVEAEGDVAVDPAVSREDHVHRATSRRSSLTFSGSIPSPRLRLVPTMAPSATESKVPAFEEERPLPTRTGIPPAPFRASSSSAAEGGSPVVVPVTTTASAPASRVRRADSARLRLTSIRAYFTCTSARMRMESASRLRRYRRRPSGSMRIGPPCSGLSMGSTK